ncbi:MAG: hypothetical protein J6W56_08355 [Prevotella sp.]|nr:hypothetical protein [Prevotella sp.]
MTKKMMNLFSKWNVLAIAMVAMMGIGFASCGDDGDDSGSETTLNDYYFSFEVVNRGTLSDADANALMGTLNAQTGTMTAYTKAEAIYVFDQVVEDLRTSFAGVNEFELSFRVKLMTKTTTVKSKVINIKTIGCTVE